MYYSTLYVCTTVNTYSTWCITRPCMFVRLTTLIPYDILLNLVCLYNCQHLFHMMYYSIFYVCTTVNTYSTWCNTPPCVFVRLSTLIPHDVSLHLVCLYDCQHLFHMMYYLTLYVSTTVNTYSTWCITPPCMFVRLSTLIPHDVLLDLVCVYDGQHLFPMMYYSILYICTTVNTYSPWCITRACMFVRLSPLIPQDVLLHLEGFYDCQHLFHMMYYSTLYVYTTVNTYSPWCITRPFMFVLLSTLIPHDVLLNLVCLYDSQHLFPMMYYSTFYVCTTVNTYSTWCITPPCMFVRLSTLIPYDVLLHLVCLYDCQHLFPMMYYSTLYVYTTVNTYSPWCITRPCICIRLSTLIPHDVLLDLVYVYDCQHLFPVMYYSTLYVCTTVNTYSPWCITQPCMFVRLSTLISHDVLLHLLFVLLSTLIPHDVLLHLVCLYDCQHLFPMMYYSTLYVYTTVNTYSTWCITPPCMFVRLSTLIPHDVLLNLVCLYDCQHLFPMMYYLTLYVSTTVNTYSPWCITHPCMFVRLSTLIPHDILLYLVYLYDCQHLFPMMYYSTLYVFTTLNTYSPWCITPPCMFIRLSTLIPHDVLLDLVCVYACQHLFHMMYYSILYVCTTVNTYSPWCITPPCLFVLLSTLIPHDVLLDLVCLYDWQHLFPMIYYSTLYVCTTVNTYSTWCITPPFMCVRLSTLIPHDVILHLVCLYDCQHLFPMMYYSILYVCTTVNTYSTWCITWLCMFLRLSTLIPHDVILHLVCLYDCQHLFPMMYYSTLYVCTTVNTYSPWCITRPCIFVPLSTLIPHDVLLDLVCLYDCHHLFPKMYYLTLYVSTTVNTYSTWCITPPCMFVRLSTLIPHDVILDLVCLYDCQHLFHMMYYSPLYVCTTVNTYSTWCITRPCMFIRLSTLIPLDVLLDLVCLYDCQHLFHMMYYSTLYVCTTVNTYSTWCITQPCMFVRLSTLIPHDVLLDLVCLYDCQHLFHMMYYSILYVCTTVNTYSPWCITHPCMFVRLSTLIPHDILLYLVYLYDCQHLFPMMYYSTLYVFTTLNTYSPWCITPPCMFIRLSTLIPHDALLDLVCVYACQHLFHMMYYSTLYVCTTVNTYSPWCITPPCLFVPLSTLIPHDVLLDLVCLYDCHHLFPKMYYLTLYVSTTVNTYSTWCITPPCMFVRLSTLIPNDVILDLVCFYDCQHLFHMMYYSTLYVCTTVNTYSTWCITRPCMFIRLSTLIPLDVLLDLVCLYDCQHLFHMMYYSTLYVCTTVNTYSPWCITRPCMFVRLSTLIPHDVLLDLVCLYDCQHLFPMMYYLTLYVSTTVNTYSPWGITHPCMFVRLSTLIPHDILLYLVYLYDCQHLFPMMYYSTLYVFTTLNTYSPWCITPPCMFIRLSTLIPHDVLLDLVCVYACQHLFHMMYYSTLYVCTTVNTYSPWCITPPCLFVPLSTLIPHDVLLDLVCLYHCQHLFHMMYYSTFYVCTTVNTYSTWCNTPPCMFVRLSTLIPHDVLLHLVCLYDCQHLFHMMYYLTLYASTTVNTYSTWCNTPSCMFVRLSTLIPHDVLLDLVYLYHCHHLFPKMYYLTLYVSTTVNTYSTWCITPPCMFVRLSTLIPHDVILDLVCLYDCQHLFHMMYYSTLYVCTTVNTYSTWCITRPCMFIRLSTLFTLDVLLDLVCLYDCQHLFHMMYYSTLYVCTTVNTYSTWCITQPSMFVRLSTLIPHDVLLDLVCLYDCQHLFHMMYYSILYVCTTVNTYSTWCITRPFMLVLLSILIPHDVLLDLVCLYDCQHLFHMMYYSTLNVCTTVNTYSPWCITRPCMFVRLSTLIPHDVLLDLVCLYDCQHLFLMIYYSTLYVCTTVNTYSPWCITQPCMLVRLSTLIHHDVLLSLVCLYHCQHFFPMMYYSTLYIYMTVNIYSPWCITQPCMLVRLSTLIPHDVVLHLVCLYDC